MLTRALRVFLGVAFLPLAWSAGSPPGAQVPYPAPLDELSRYTALVDAFAAGDNEAVRRLAEWPPKRIMAALAMVHTGGDPATRWTRRRFTAAAVLHTAIVVELLGYTERDAEMDVHVNAAIELLRKGGEEVRPFAARWYVAVARLQLDRSRIEQADRLLRTARRELPESPEVHYTSGVFFEFLAGPLSFEELGRVAAGARVGRIESAVGRMQQRRAGRLNDAAKFFRAALERQPGDRLALLHLARVEMLRGHESVALARLQELRVEPASEPEVAFLAALFEGAIHERNSRLEQAVASYRAATAILPQSQSAYVALSEALQRGQRGEESRAVLTERLRRREVEAGDPWWSYFLETTARTTERLNQLLAEARR